MTIKKVSFVNEQMEPNDTKINYYGKMKNENDLKNDLLFNDM